MRCGPTRVREAREDPVLRFFVGEDEMQERDGAVTPDTPGDRNEDPEDVFPGRHWSADYVGRLWSNSMCTYAVPAAAAEAVTTTVGSPWPSTFTSTPHSGVPVRRKT